MLPTRVVYVLLALVVTWGPIASSVQPTEDPVDAPLLLPEEAAHLETPARLSPGQQGVAIDGDTAAVGLPGQDDPAVLVFERGDDGAWAQTARLTGPWTPHDSIGWSIDLDGDTLVAGAHRAPTGQGGSPGRAYVFQQGDQGDWGLQTAVSPPDSRAKLFGGGVAVADDALAIGAHRASGEEGGEGRVYTFTLGDDGSVSHDATFHPPDPTHNGELGAEMVAHADADGVTVLVRDRDAAQVYVRDVTGTWSHQATLPSEGEIHPAVGLHGDTAVLGLETDGADVFQRTAGTWEKVARISPPDGARRFASAVAVSGAQAGPVSLDGLTILVGDRGDATAGDLAGAAHVYTGYGSHWIHQATLVPENAEPGDEYGPVAVDGAHALVGSRYDGAAVFEGLGAPVDATEP